jgi:hypothetical protein
MHALRSQLVGGVQTSVARHHAQRAAPLDFLVRRVPPHRWRTFVQPTGTATAGRPRAPRTLCSVIFPTPLYAPCARARRRPRSVLAKCL